MKRAHIPDIWKVARKTLRRPIRRINVEWSGVSRLSDGEFAFFKPFTLLCGENGAGKSSLLHLIYHALSPDGSIAQRGNYSRPHGGQVVRVSVEIAGQEAGAPSTELTSSVEIAGHFCPADGVRKVSLVDAGMHIPALLEFIKNDANFNDYLEGVEPARFSAPDSEAVAYIVGRTYQEILVFELEDTAFGCTVPYFRVQAYGVTYDSPDMGYGELAVLYLIWLFGRMEIGSLALVEEPEAFLSPRAQVALVDTLARFVAERGITLIMTSHSGAIATRLESSEIVYVARSAGSVVMQSPPRTSDLISRLGLISDRSFVFFVEDLAGEIISRTLVDRYSNRLSGLVEYVISRGESNVLRALEVLPQSLRSVAHVGVLDGDQRARTLQDERVIYLPGDVPPERFLRNFCDNSDPKDIAACLRVEVSRYQMAFGQADGCDHHDWPYSLAAALGIPYSDLIRMLALGWAERNEGEVEAFVKDAERFSLAV
ncbi:ATP-dependent nuclease [Cognatilysobacter tabacisoli]|uniref:ATP-dependent nuclease n=1 Tax=Cognatilysobacter tabacisoli TaxID=2315424 RepID=UPI000E6AE579|nr:AAA family ATPase [Lysobacter tabacisoli]